jgi:hypothetical protein
MTKIQPIHAAAVNLPCPFCGVGAGSPCLGRPNARGERRVRVAWHRDRLWAARRARLTGSGYQRTSGARSEAPRRSYGRKV